MLLNITNTLLNISGGNLVYLAFLNGLIIALLTSIGALIGLIGRGSSGKWINLALGFASGIMLVASFTSLILPAIEAGRLFDTSIGILIGIVLIISMDKMLPHEHYILGYEGPVKFRGRIRKVWLLAIAMIIHNIPEGLAVGVATIYSPSLGVLTAIAIGIQDVPEGTAVTMPLYAVHGKAKMPLLIGILSGLVETIAAVSGAIAFIHLNNLLGIGMGLAGGAMIYVVVEEIFPEIFSEREKRSMPTIGFIIGLYVMLYLDTLLG
ncbi:MAG TPA: ZIP family metal transporter [Desulfurococcaceae archaeon]|nr:ZIP family metal transporter [Desulfurococcaceae archaeon]